MKTLLSNSCLSEPYGASQSTRTRSSRAGTVSRILRLFCVGLSLKWVVGLEAQEVPFQMLVPGFTVEELPVKLTSLNNVEYAPDGRLFAGGYDGRFHVLLDTDGDGTEDAVHTFSPEPSPNYPLGMAVRDGMPYAVLTDEVVRWRDTDDDGIPDQRETVAKGFDDPAMIEAPYLNHRRVDSSMALAFGADGSLYVTMGNAGYNNPYWHDKVGVAHYTTEQRRGCLLRIDPDGTVVQLASGLRYIMSLQFNQYGDLFGSDQEGATWVPNGNPFDELLHIQEGRHYGFPPRHPRWLPDVIDEPSVMDYAPQHQSTCGFRFNGPTGGRARFGPELWAHDALTVGESRGKLWRTTLAKTAAGYVARAQLVGSVPLLAVDCTISPDGDLVVCTHTGKPDWGNGPKGAGRIFKIRMSDDTAAQPVLVWPRSESSTVVAFDRPVEPDAFTAAFAWEIDSGRYAAAADRLETMRPGYGVVALQQRQARTSVPVKNARLSEDRRELVLESSARDAAVNYVLNHADQLDLAHDLSGVEAEWSGGDETRWQGWLPHPDFVAARSFTRGSASHDRLWQLVGQPGTLAVLGQLDLSRMLIPRTQPGSILDYEPEAETVTLTFKSDGPLGLEAPGARVERVSDWEQRLTVQGADPNRWYSFRLKLKTPATTLDVSFVTDRDSRPRPLATGRFLVPFAKPGAPDDLTRRIPQLAGGNWSAGRALYFGKAACGTCHTIRGEGSAMGPDLSNSIHADFYSLYRNITRPSASINPDAVGYTVTLKDGSELVGTRVGETEAELRLAQANGVLLRVEKSKIAETKPMTVSLMPEGLFEGLSDEERRDLMMFLLFESAAESLR